MCVNGIISNLNQGLSQDPAQDPFRVRAEKNTLIRLHIFFHIAWESMDVNGIIRLDRLEGKVGGGVKSNFTPYVCCISFGPHFVGSFYF